MREAAALLSSGREVGGGDGMEWANCLLGGLSSGALRAAYGCAIPRPFSVAAAVGYSLPRESRRLAFVERGPLVGG